MIRARSIGYRHSSRSPWLFAGLSFGLGRGQTLVLLGRNGRGKTTLLKCLAGLLAPSAGDIERRGLIGHVPQHFAPVFAYSVFDLVLMGRARHVGLFANPTRLDRARARDAIDLIGLGPLAERAVTTLSGGERQLVLIARAIASEAEILLLDEPASALDFRNQAIVLATLRRLADQRGLAIVMSTHDPSHALAIGDRAVFLDGAGRAVEGGVDELCSEARLSELYSLPMRRLDYTVGHRPVRHVAADFGSLSGP